MGSHWTEDKLCRVEEYFERYNVALKNQRFTREYIDAFAGTGYREVREEGGGGGLMFPGLVEPEVQWFLDGSARKALIQDLVAPARFCPWAAGPGTLRIVSQDTGGSPR